jgi:hypothetical protein
VRAKKKGGTANGARTAFMRAIQHRKRSSGPNTSAGRTIVAPGASARTAASPSDLVRAHSDSENASAASADT